MAAFTDPLAEGETYALRESFAEIMKDVSNIGVSTWRSLLGYLRDFSIKIFREWKPVFFKGGGARGKAGSLHPESNVSTGASRQIYCISQ